MGLDLMCASSHGSTTVLWIRYLGDTAAARSILPGSIATFFFVSSAQDPMRTLTILQPLTPVNRHPWPGKPRFLNTRPQLVARAPRQFRGGAKGFGGSRDAGANEAEEAKSTRKEAKYGDDGDDEIPEEVRNKIISRILIFVGVPLGIGLAILQVLSVLSDQGLWVVPKWVPFLTTFFTFGASVLGIAYGTLSTSLSPEEEGTFLGLEQLERNWNEMWKEDNEG